MFLGSKEAVLAMLQQLTAAQPIEQPLRIAVAFWGCGAEAIVVPGRQYQIVCNLLRGGTNPGVIRALSLLPNVEIRHLSELHAKVFLAEGGAIVGSANFSADGLGIGRPVGSGWIEAAAVVDAAAVGRWFDSVWNASIKVDDDALTRATELWSSRIPFAAEEGASSAPIDPAPQLSESDLFKSAITGGNKIRMAARPIELIYFQAIEPESKRSVWNPAYAASVIWTAAGNRIRTKIDDCPYFENPSDVLERARYPKTIEKVHRFLEVLSKHSNVSPAIRYWASLYLRNAT
jgi:hypothetical protein